jgi:UPF0716 protein FxsA
MKILFAILLAIFVEIFTFIKVGTAIGAMTAISITILSAIIGLSLVRKASDKEQIKALHKMQEGKTPVKETLSGLCLLFAGILLLIPGLITDAFGALLLIPFIRHIFISHAISKFDTFTKNHTMKAESVHVTIKGKKFSHNKDIIEGEFVEHNDN